MFISYTAEDVKALRAMSREQRREEIKRRQSDRADLIARERLSWSEIVSLGDCSKGELFANVETRFDYALPQSWLDAFATWARERAYPEASYSQILGTTVWQYIDGVGTPMMKCKEVYIAYSAYCWRNVPTS